MENEIREAVTQFESLLRQQLGYHYPEGGTDYVFYWMDPLYEPHDDSVTDPLCPY